jgi:hypothetical protein
MIVSEKQLVIKRSEWECYTDTPDKVIDRVNTRLLCILNRHNNPIIAQKYAYNYLYENHREWGFSDSECNQCVTDVINVYYNSNIDRWASLSL